MPKSVTSSKQIKGTTIGDIIKIGTSYVIINSNNEGSMTFGELAKTNGETYKVAIANNKISDPSIPCPDDRIGTKTFSKAQVATFDSKRK